MSFCHEALDYEEMALHCRRDRDALQTEMLELYPRLGKSPPAAWVEDLLPRLCAFRVHELPLPHGQLGLCDISNQLVIINSKMEEFVHHKTDLVALRRSTLAHELGHIRLHSDELVDQFVSHHKPYQDTRYSQKEMEADLYAAIFLAPVEWIVKHQKAQGLLQARQERRTWSSSTIWRTVYAVANFLKVSPSLMLRRFEELRWIRQTRTPKGKTILQLRF